MALGPGLGVEPDRGQGVAKTHTVVESDGHPGPSMASPSAGELAEQGGDPAVEPDESHLVGLVVTTSEPS